MVSPEYLSADDSVASAFTVPSSEGVQIPSLRTKVVKLGDCARFDVDHIRTILTERTGESTPK